MGVGRKLVWSMGATGGAASMFAFTSFVSFFYIDFLKMDPMLYGLGMVVFAIWNAINDPLLGHLSDNTRSRWGRRVPYVLFGALPLALSFALIWMPPGFSTQAGEAWLFVYFLITICFFDTMYTLVFLNWAALYPEMYPAGKERAQVAVMRQLFSVAGLAFGVALPPMLYGTGNGTPAGWTSFGIVLAITTAIPTVVSSLASKETGAFMQYPRLSLLESVRSGLNNRSFWTFGAANMAVNFAFYMLTGVFPFYAKYVLHVDGMPQTILMGCILGTTALMTPLWAFLTSTYGPRAVMAASSLVLALATIPFVTAVTYTQGLIGCLLLGVGLSGLIPIVDIAVADIVDEDEIRSGCRREGLYFGLNGFLIRIAVALQAGAMAAVMKLTGFNADRPSQTPQAIQGLRALMSPAVIAVLLLGMLMLWAYPLYGSKLKNVRAAQAGLRERRPAEAASNPAK